MEGIDKNADGDTTDAGEQITVIDTTADTSWVPVGDNSTDNDTTRFTGIFEGNNHTIANFWVNVSSSSRVYAGLFGVTGGTVVIRNVGVVSGAIHAFSSTHSISGGLVGHSLSSLAITNCTFSVFGGVSSSSPSTIDAGGLVGHSLSPLTITNCTFSGSGGVFANANSGGLVGFSEDTSIITSRGLFLDRLGSLLLVLILVVSRCFYCFFDDHPFLF